MNSQEKTSDNGIHMRIDRGGESIRLLAVASIVSVFYLSPVQAQDEAIPSQITDGSIWDLEGDLPNPLINETTLQFLPLEAQVATPNGNGWRHEYKIEESMRVPMGASYELFQATYTVSMSDGAKSIVNQYHGDDPTLMKLYYADSSEKFFDSLGNPIGDSIGKNGVFDLYVRLRTKGLPGFGEDVFHFGTFVAGDSFDLSVENDYGTVTVAVNELSVTREIEQTSADYLKFGNYLQSQVTTDENHPFGGEKCSQLVPALDFPECYEFLGITESIVSLTNVTFERVVDPDFTLPPPDANPELLNGDFEDSLNGWTQGEPASPSGETNSGLGSAKINDAPGRIYQRVELLPNTEYEFVVFVNGEGAVGVKGTASIDDIANGEVDLVERFDVSDWTMVSITFTTGADPLPVYVYGLHGSSGAVRFDDFSLLYGKPEVIGSMFCPSANDAPAGSFDLANWRIKVSDDAGSTLTPAELAVLNDEFLCLTDNGAMVFYAPVNGGTAGSTYPRTELRELIDPDDSNVGWEVSGSHTISASSTVTLAPSTGKIVIAQVDSLSDDILAKIQWDNDRIRVQLRQINADGTPGSYEDFWFDGQNASFALGTTFDWDMSVEDGVLSVTVNGETTTTDFAMLSTAPSAYADDELYFSAGSQPQDNVLDSAGEAGEVLFHSLNVRHISTPVSNSSCPSSFGPPATAFDLTNWRIKLPDEEGTTLSPDELATLDNEFFCLSDDGAMTLYAPVAGGTDGSTYPRTELRQLTNPDDSDIGWAAADVNTMSASTSVTQSPSNGKIVIAQLDSLSDDIVAKIQWDNERIRAQLRQIDADGSAGSYEDFWFADKTESFPVGTPFSWDMSIDNGVLTVSVNGEAVTHDFAMLTTSPSDYADDEFYFSAGSQPQDNIEEAPGGEIEAGEVRFFSFDVNRSTATVAALNLRHDVYSSSAAELFWNRFESNGPVRYEVTRNGEPLGRFDALSFFDDDLTSGVTYNYTVSVVDVRGDQLVTENTTLVAGAGSGSGESFPTGIRADVYSSTAAELFWDRPADIGLSYEVERDDVVIGLIDGVSFFDNSLSPGVSYQYRVTSIDATGIRSANFAQTLLTTRQ